VDEIDTVPTFFEAKRLHIRLASAGSTSMPRMRHVIDMENWNFRKPSLLVYQA
jgi:hypothetical protein